MLTFWTAVIQTNTYSIPSGQLILNPSYEFEMTGNPDNFVAKSMAMHRSLLLLTSVLFLACSQPEAPAGQSEAASPHEVLLHAADSLILALEQRMETAGGEFDHLKFRNMRDIIRANRESLAQTTSTTDGKAEQRVQLETQADYLQSLLIAAGALLSDNPLSVGKWEGEVQRQHDSVQTPVGRSR